MKLYCRFIVLVLFCHWQCLSSANGSAFYDRMVDLGMVPQEVFGSVNPGNTFTPPRNRQEAVERLTEEARKGDDNKQLQLGCALWAEAGSIEEKEQSIRWLTQSAEKGNVKACVALGHALMKFSLEKRDASIKDKTLHWLSVGAEHNEEDAYFGLGKVYEGFYFPECSDREKAMEAYRKAIALGDNKGEATACLAQLIARDDHIDRASLLEAEKLFRDGVSKNNASCMFSLAQLLLDDKIPELQPGEGVGLLKSAAEHNNEACILLGVNFLRGTSKFQRNPDEGIFWFRKAAQGIGSPPHYRLALANALLEKGDLASKREALGWCKKAASEGYSVAQGRLLSLYEAGIVDEIEHPALSSAISASIRATLSPLLESSLQAIGTLVGDLGPTCFIARCYSGEDPKILEEQDRINCCLHLMGVRTILDINGDQSGLPVGADIRSFMERGILDSDFILYCLTPKGLERSRDPTSGFATELSHVVKRLKQTHREKKEHDYLIPLLMAGNDISSVPVEFDRLLFINALDGQTGNFSLMTFFKEIWPLFETRFFKNHPKVREIKDLLPRKAIELGFMSQERTAFAAAASDPLLRESEVQSTNPRSKKIDLSKINVDDLLDHPEKIDNPIIYAKLMEMVSQDPDLSVDIARIQSSFQDAEAIKMALRPILKLFVRLNIGT